jgi:hypothetical protein
MDLTKLFADEEAQIPVDVSYDIIRHVSAQLYTRRPNRQDDELSVDPTASTTKRQDVATRQRVK